MTAMEPAARPMCWRCRWPRELCWCGRIQPMATRTRFVLLMHPKEARHVKANTGRFTHLCLENSQLWVGDDFNGHAGVAALLADPGLLPVLLYPSGTPVRVGEGPLSPASLAGPPERSLCVFVLDATWSCSRSMYRLNPWLRQLPHLGISPGGPSRYRIKRQPGAQCLSTLEAVHEVLLDLEAAGLDAYERPAMMLDLFAAMQEHQLRYAQPGVRQPRTDGPRQRQPGPDRQLPDTCQDSCRAGIRRNAGGA